MPKVSVGRAALDTRNFILYRYFDRAGVLLYVGITVDIRARENKHARHSAWWAKVDHEATVLERYVGERAVRAAETAAIKAEKPLENDLHNEFVEVSEDESQDALHDFAVNVLSWLHPEELDPLLEESRLDWDDEPRSDRDRDIAAAESAVAMLWRAQRDLTRVIGQAIDLLPGDKAEDHRFQARREWEIARGLEAGSASDEDLPASFAAKHTMQSSLREQALDVLRALPLDEAKEWVASARAAGVSGETDRLAFAARYVRMFRESGWGIVGLCQGPGKSGARCPSKTECTVFFEACGACSEPLNCTGHGYWCKKHALAVQAGDMTLLRCNPAALWPLKRVEDIQVPAKPELVF